MQFSRLSVNGLIALVDSDLPSAVKLVNELETFFVTHSYTPISTNSKDN
jgi:hypothetical protein